MDSNTFWATVLATGLGVVFAFLLDFFVRLCDKHEKRKNEKNKLIQSLKTISASISENMPLLISLENSITTHQPKISFPIDFHTLDSMKHEINNYCDNIRLKFNISKYFREMEYLYKLFELDFSLQNELRGSHTEERAKYLPEMIDTVENGNLLRKIPELRGFSENLISEINSEIKTLK